MSRSLLEAYYGAEGVEVLEKTAQANFIEKLAADYGHDISSLSPDQRQEFESLVLQDLQGAGLVEGGEDPTEKVAEPAGVEEEEEHERYAREMADAFTDQVEKRAAAAAGKEKVAGDLNSVPVPSTDTPGQTPGWLSSLWGQAQEPCKEGQGMPKLDKLAEARAEEMLKLAAEAMEGEADPLDDAVTLRSLEMIDDAGYDSDLVTEKVAAALEAAEAKEKRAEEEKKKTYPISRFLTNPVTSAAAGGISGALRGGIGGAAAMSKGGKSFGAKGALIGALLGGGLGTGIGGLAGSLWRGAFLRGARGRANMGQEGSSESEKAVLKALAEAKEKRAEEEKKKTYPISRFLTNPAAAATFSGGSGGVLGAGAGLAHGLTTAQALRGLGKGAILKAILGGALGAGVGGLGGYTSAAGLRGLGLRATRGRANMGQEGSSESEKAVLKALKAQS